MRVLRSWRFGIGAAFALCVGAALAADPATPTYPECPPNKKPTAQDLEGAKGAHKAATQFYDRGEYDKAARYWQDALGFDCTANDLLLNIANAYEKGGNLPAAVATLYAYQKRTGPNPVLQERIHNLEARMAPPDAGPATTATAPPPVPDAGAPLVPTAVPTALPPVVGQRPYGNTPWIVVGGGGALAIVGAILLPLGYNAISSASAQCNAQRKCGSNQSAVNQGNTGRTEAGAGWGLLGVGVAAAAGGLGWQLAGNKPQAAAQQSDKRGMWLAPAGPGQVGVSAGGSF
jgi:tetratricopeptide (TPR) repeat protein